MRSLPTSCRYERPNEMFLLVIIACLTSAAANNTTKDALEPTNTKELLKASESDPTKVEIVKQIKRLNDDGSYTIGYEADDGTFKIESRDVLGNVKGTFGYIDKDGEIKRVTYSSTSESTPVPVTTSTTPSMPAMVVRVNKTVSSTTRKPLATVVYPSRSYTTRGTVIQSIPRRRVSSSRITTTEATTEKQNTEETTSTILNLYKTKTEDTVKTRTQMQKPMSAAKDDLDAKQTTTKLPQTIKPVYEHVSEREPEVVATKVNNFRREFSRNSPNPHMLSLQQSVGDDSTDEYGSPISLGTIRPLFTTTTPRQRLVPIQTIVAARQKIHDHYQQIPAEEQETTIEASTGRVFDQESDVTSNPVPVIHIPIARDPDDRVYQQPVYRRPSSPAQFRTREYLRDNPGAAVPIGNQRPFLQYELQDKVLDPQFIKDSLPHQEKPEASTSPYELRPVTRIIPIPVDERGVPIQEYRARFANPYRSQPVLQQPRYEPVDEMSSITAPVSTRDLRRLLHILILRQNRLQALMDQMMPISYQFPYRDDYRYQNRYQEDYDYSYQPHYRNEYQNQIYDNQYENQRYMPRRRYQRPYDTVTSSSNHINEMPEFLPAEVREALLLKMLVLAISPDFIPTPAPATEMTTASPPRKQIRNVQILGEENSADKKTPARRQ